MGFILFKLMVRYLTLSALINLIFFSLISLLLYGAAKPVERKVEGFLKPLVVSVEIQTPKVVEAKIETRKVEVKEQKPAQKVVKVEKPKEEEKPSLLEEVLPEVKSTLEAYQRLKTTASVKIKNGKAELKFKRKVVYAPPVQPIKVEYPPSPAVVRITVLPDGRVVSAVFVKRTGIAKVDQAVLNFLKNLRFEPINKPQIQVITVKIEFTF